MPKTSLVSRAAALLAALHVSSAAMAQAQPAKPYADLHSPEPFEISGCVGGKDFASISEDTNILLQPKGCFGNPPSRILVSRGFLSGGDSTSCSLDEGQGQVANIEVQDPKGRILFKELRPQATGPLRNMANLIKGTPAGTENSAGTLEALRGLLPVIDRACFDKQLTS